MLNHLEIPAMMPLETGSLKGHFIRLCRDAIFHHHHQQKGIVMKKMMLAALLMLAMIFGTTPAFAQLCTTIQDGTLINSAGDTITSGYDTWGYNYQARIFNGKYCDAYRNAVWCQPYVNDDLEMKWNDAWLSNKDCDGEVCLIVITGLHLTSDRVHG